MKELIFGILHRFDLSLRKITECNFLLLWADKTIHSIFGIQDPWQAEGCAMLDEWGKSPEAKKWFEETYGVGGVEWRRPNRLYADAHEWGQVWTPEKDLDDEPGTFLNSS